MLTTCFNETSTFDNDEFNRLVAKFHRLIHFYAHKYYIADGGEDDLYQWGLIGLYKAVLSYEENSLYSFDLIAQISIKNMMKSAITKSNRQKHKFANEARSLSERNPGFSGSLQLLDRLVVSHNLETDPLEVIDSKESAERIFQIIDNCLSDNERRVMRLYIDGYKQGQISGKLRIGAKAVDNAIQRSRKKLAYYIKNIDYTPGLTRLNNTNK